MKGSIFKLNDPKHARRMNKQSISFIPKVQGYQVMKEIRLKRGLILWVYFRCFLYHFYYNRHKYCHVVIHFSFLQKTMIALSESGHFSPFEKKRKTSSVIDVHGWLLQNKDFICFCFGNDYDRYTFGLFDSFLCTPASYKSFNITSVTYTSSDSKLFFFFFSLVSLFTYGLLLVFQTN